MPTSQIKITREQFESGDVPGWNSAVIVEMEHSAEGYTTQSGIIVGFNVDDIYEEGTESHAADLAEVYGKVVRVPKNLDYNKEDLNHMSWLPEMEIDVGDYVWFNPLIAKNCSEIIVDHKLYKCIPYDHIFVARKGGHDGDICPVNGHCLLERMFYQPLSKFDIISRDKVYPDRGKVAYIGKPNLEYQNPLMGDIQDICVGDVAYFTEGYKPILLERKAFMAGFDGDNLYYATQRRRIALTVKDE